LMNTPSIAWTRFSAALLGAVVLFAAALAAAQGQAPPTAPNPPAGDPEAVRVGTGLFRERCAECHGADGKGVAGHDLTRLWASGATDAQVFGTLRGGGAQT